MTAPSRRFAAQPRPQSSLAPRELWQSVDGFITSTLPHDDEPLRNAITHSQEKGLKDIAVSATQGKFLHLLAKTIDPVTIVEYGTLGGALRDVSEAHLYTLELKEYNAGIARTNLKNAGLSDKVTVVVGRAEDSADRLREEGKLKDVDLAFIDADKELCSTYVAQSLAVARPGSIIIVDNVIRSGAIIEADFPDTRVRGVRHVYAYLAELEKEGYLESTALQTVGEKNYDGFLYCRVLKSKPYVKPAGEPISA